MVSRNYKCAQCSKVFKTENGRNWHIAHRHEINNAINNISQEYESKLTSLKDENRFLQQKAADFENELNKSMLLLYGQKIAEVEAYSFALKSEAEAQQTRNELYKASLLTVAQGNLIEQKLGIPFNRSLEEFEKIMYPATAAATTDTKTSNKES